MYSLLSKQFGSELLDSLRCRAFSALDYFSSLTTPPPKPTADPKSPCCDEIKEEPCSGNGVGSVAGDPVGIPHGVFKGNAVVGLTGASSCSAINGVTDEYGGCGLVCVVNSVSLDIVCLLCSVLLRSSKEPELSPLWIWPRLR